MLDDHPRRSASATVVATALAARPRRSRHVRRALASTDVIAALAVSGLLAILLLPALAEGRAIARSEDSLSNLRVLGTAHAAYGSDWNDRQWTAVVDVLAAFGDDAGAGFQAYNDDEPSINGRHPGITLGWAPLESGSISLYQYRTNNIANARLCEPIVFNGTNEVINRSFGSFRLVNDARFTPYVGGKFYDATFYAAEDPVVWDLVGPFTDDPFEYVDSPGIPGFGDAPYWSSYSLSAAAMFAPEVMAARRLEAGGPTGGWVDPWSLDLGLQSPVVSQARYPNLKTRMLEHHWLRKAPFNPCLEDFPRPAYSAERLGLDVCEPAHFNHSLEASPATLFFDGSTRHLPNVEVQAADELVRAASGGAGYDGIWSRTTPFGEDGLEGEFALDGLRLSHHVLTADGILGRDTLDPAALDAPPVRRRVAPAPPETGLHAAPRTIRSTLRTILGGGEAAETFDAGPYRE